MTTDNVPMQDHPESPLDAEEAPTPKRTRRIKTTEGAAPESAVAAPAIDAVAAPKRSPRRRTTGGGEALEEGVPTGSSAADDELVDEVKAKRAPRKKAALASVDEVTPAASAGAQDVTPHGVLELGESLMALPDGPSIQTDSAPPQRHQRDHPRDRDRDRGQRGDRPPRGDWPVQHDAVDGVEQGDAMAEPAEMRTSRRAAIAAEQATEVFAELLSGDFDKQREEEAEEAVGEEAAAYKRVLRPEPDAPKLQKVLAQAGVGSRRDIEQMIEDGRIEVNDQVAHIGQRISYGDRIKVAGRPIKVRIAPQPARILAYHKPVGEVVTHDDPQGRPTVFRRLPRLVNGKWMSVGRLDLNTEGLLLFTNSGELANQLMHPRFGVEREYAVRVLGSLDDTARTRLLSGVEIEGQSASFVSISNGGGEGVNQWYRVVITEGRNREVRKLFDTVGLTVNRLIRVRYGAIVLPRGLKRGVWVELGESDVRAVKSLAGMDHQEFNQGQGRHGQGRGQQVGPNGPKGPKGQQQNGFKGKNGRGGSQQQQPGQGGGRPSGAGGGQQGGGYGAPQNRQARPGPDRQQQAPRHDGDDDLDHVGPIPNPLEQTFDRRFVKGSKRITSGFGRPDQDHGRGGQEGGQHKGPRQPDPMQTSVGYIGADAYFGKVGGGGRKGGGGNRGRR